MADALGLVVTAEGVENPEQLSILRKLQCQRGQGYLPGQADAGGRDGPAGQAGAPLAGRLSGVDRIITAARVDGRRSTRQMWTTGDRRRTKAARRGQLSTFSERGLPGHREAATVGTVTQHLRPQPTGTPVLLHRDRAARRRVLGQPHPTGPARRRAHRDLAGGVPAGNGGAGPRRRRAAPGGRRSADRPAVGRSGDQSRLGGHHARSAVRLQRTAAGARHPGGGREVPPRLRSDVASRGTDPWRGGDARRTAGDHGGPDRRGLRVAVAVRERRRVDRRRVAPPAGHPRRPGHAASPAPAGARDAQGGRCRRVRRRAERRGGGVVQQGAAAAGRAAAARAPGDAQRPSGSVAGRCRLRVPRAAGAGRVRRA